MEPNGPAIPALAGGAGAVWITLSCCGNPEQEFNRNAVDEDDKAGLKDVRVLDDRQIVLRSHRLPASLVRIANAS